MRILVAHTRYQQFGGEDVIAAAEADLLRSRGHDIRELTLSNDDIDGLTALSKLGMALWSNNGRKQLRAAIGDGVDIVHFHNTHIRLSPAALRAAKDAGAGVVLSLHNFRLVCPRGTLWRDGGVCEDCVGKRLALPGLKHKCYRGSRGATATVAAVNALHRTIGTWRKSVDAYLVHTQSARDLISRGGVPKERLLLKNNFVKTDPGDQGPPGEGLFFIGRLAEEKGIDILLAAAARMGGRLTIAGSGPCAELVEQAAKTNDRINYLGRLEHDKIIPAFKDAAATVVTSTWYEGQPMTILEALACGRPVIASNLGAMPTVIDDGVNGRLFEPGDVDTLARIMDEVLGDRAKLIEMGKAARRKFEAIGTADACYTRLMEVYEAVLEKRHPLPVEVTYPAPINPAIASS
ncbi:MAG: glycosyltransferase family 4 protein [Planctomycetota bacterium]